MLILPPITDVVLMIERNTGVAKALYESDTTLFLTGFESGSCGLKKDRDAVY